MPLASLFKQKTEHIANNRTTYDVCKHLRLSNMAICLTIHNSWKCSGREGFRSTGEHSVPSILTETNSHWCEWDWAAWVLFEALHHQSLCPPALPSPNKSVEFKHCVCMSLMTKIMPVLSDRKSCYWPTNISPKLLWGCFSFCPPLKDNCVTLCRV